MQLTEREVEVIKFINEFGYCEMPQVMRRFGLQKTRVYEMLQRLVEAKLLCHERILYGHHGVYYATHKGARYTDLPAIERVTIGRYAHQMVMLNVYNRLKDHYPEAHWVSERRLKHDLFYDGLGKMGHVADGILMFPDGKQMAIEVELSVKGKNRIEKILRAYSVQLAIHEIWYYCTSPVVTVLTSLAEKMPFIKIFNLKEFLYDQ